MGLLLQHHRLISGRAASQPVPLVYSQWHSYHAGRQCPFFSRSPLVQSSPPPLQAPRQHKVRTAYYDATSTVYSAAPEEEEYLARSREPHYPPDGPHVDEYEDSSDLGFWRVDIEDQAAFICKELDLTDDQALYLLNALGFLPEGASLADFKFERPSQQLEEDQVHRTSRTGEYLRDGVEGEAGRWSALESWQGDVADGQRAAWTGGRDSSGPPDDTTLTGWAAAAASSSVADEPDNWRTSPPSSPSAYDVAAAHHSSGYYDDDGQGRHQRQQQQQQLAQRHRDEEYYGEREGALESAASRQAWTTSGGPSSSAPAASSTFQVSIRPNIAEAKPAGVQGSPGVPVPAFDQRSFDRDFEVLQLRVIGRRDSTAAAAGEEIELAPGRLIAGRYQVLEQVGAAAFSRAVQAYDTLERRLVCLKVVKNDKDCMDACLEEVRLLQAVARADPTDSHHISRLHDYFYHLGHLFLVVELLGGNLFDTQCHDPDYFTPGRIQGIARQVLRALAFLHGHGIIHADVKPENILVKNYSKCSVKLIDLGCSLYHSEAHTSHYVQSRSYRAPEVMLGLPYDGRIDVWSLGCVLAELATGQVLFPNVSEAAMMSRLVGMLGPLPPHMLRQGTYAGAFFTRSGRVYERNSETGLFELLAPKRTNLQARVPSPDRGLLHFLRHLLVPDPDRRPTAAQALRHPWLQYRYRSPK